MKFLNQNLAIFNKGNYEPVDREFLSEMSCVVRPLLEIQKKYKKLDNDTLLNEYRDSLIGIYLDFELVNTLKHGFDCKKSVNEEIYLEVKQASTSAKEWNATFNDTNEEKAYAFMDEKMFLALGIWQGISELQMIVYGQNKQIGEFLLERVQNRKQGSRSTQSITFKNLIVKYGFKIKPVVEKSEVEKLLLIKYNNQDWWKNAFE